MKEKVIVMDKNDFPFYDVSMSRWLIAMAILFIGFIIPNIIEVKSRAIAIIMLIVTFLLPLFIIDIRFFPKLFKWIKLKDIGLVLFTTILVFLTAFITANLINDSGMVENPIKDYLTPDSIVIVFLFTLVSLIAEEIIFVIPFLFVYNHIKGNRNFKIIVALLVSSIIFGLAHLWTYNFNLIQCLFVIGVLRIPMSIPYILRKNLFLTYLVHVIYDWIILFSVYYAVNHGIIIQ